MLLEISEIINKHYKNIRNNPNYYIKIEIGKFSCSEIFELCQFDIIFKEYIMKKYKLCSKSDFYRYQYQNQYYQRQRNFKSQSFTDSLIESHIKHDDVDYRISLHYKEPLETFSQQMSYHNIVFVNEMILELTSNSQIHIYEYNKKSEKWFEFYFKVNVPLSEQSLKEINNEIITLSNYFKHKYDKKHKYHSLDSVLESEQSHQDEDLDNEPSHHHEE
jgi:hypothetical protein